MSAVQATSVPVTYAAVVVARTRLTIGLRAIGWIPEEALLALLTEVTGRVVPAVQAHAMAVARGCVAVALTRATVCGFALSCIAIESFRTDLTILPSCVVRAIGTLAGTVA